MLKMKFSVPSYSIKKDGKTTVCVYYCEIYDTETETTLENFIALGESTCAEEDTFDAKIGERFAESHAKRYAYNKAIEYTDLTFDKVKIVETRIERSIDILNFYDYMKYLRRVENKHLHKLLKKTC